MKAVGLKVQITVLVILLLAGIVAAFSWMVATNERRMLLDEARRRVLLSARVVSMGVSRVLAAGSVESELRLLITSLKKADPSIASIKVVDLEGESIGRPDGPPYRGGYGGSSDSTAPGPHRPPQNEELIEEEHWFEAAVPVARLHEPFGTVYVRYSKDDVTLAVDGINKRLMRLGLIAIAAGAFVSLVLAGHIARPVSALTRSVEAFGRGTLDRDIEVHSIREIQTLAHAFNDMARRIRSDRKGLVEKKRMEKELEIAHEIQGTLLPSSLPHLVDYEMDVYYHPASHVGGDYFDLIPLGDKHLFVVVGDVAGKGVPGLVIMAMVRVIVRALALERERPADLLRQLNILLEKDMKKNIFVTLFCGLLDAERGILDFASAAHMPLLVYRGKDRTVRMIGTRTKPLGLFPDAVFSKDLEEKRVALEPGDLFMQYTDGLNEMKNESREEFGIERIMQIAVDEAAGGARHFIKHIKRRLSEFKGGERQSDDLTLLAISALPEGMERAPVEKMELLDAVVFD
ncbi:MAG TPA: HAMP domain-containing protein [Candidatus Eisenbacteria bacterium]|uniref:HAMP domain-containing protein n=1 Tax=Eiseniibacteriota bacterium TaxID=2212470 RepID=A0A7V2AUJ7_UNCEI|nr:HAMP domain-containing protein [Candidatus Eisenbacteria bacterium]